MRIDDDANIVAMAKVIKEEVDQEKNEDGQIKFEDSRKA